MLSVGMLSIIRKVNSLEKHAKPKIFVYSTAFLLLTIILLTRPAAIAASNSLKWSPDVHFRLPAYDTTITFDDWIYIDSFEWDDSNATQVTFNNIKMDGETLSSWSISVQNANLTVLHLFQFSNKLDLRIIAPNETTSITKVSTAAKGKPVDIFCNGTKQNENSTWTYALNILTLNMTHLSATNHQVCFNVEIFFHPSAISPTVALGVGVVVAGGAILAYVYYRKKKTRVASTP
jgi:hypothetical protein